jgi:hypothetical protein
MALMLAYRIVSVTLVAEEDRPRGALLQLAMNTSQAL